MNPADETITNNVKRLLDARKVLAEKRDVADEICRLMEGTTTPEIEAARKAAEDAHEKVVAAQIVFDEKRTEVERIQTEMDAASGLTLALEEEAEAERARAEAEADFRSTPWLVSDNRLLVQVDSNQSFVVEKVERAGRLAWGVAKIKTVVDAETYEKLEKACRTAPTMEIKILEDQAAGGTKRKR